MGGINCGGGGGGNVSLEFSTEYIEQLASYCKSLFDGSAKFFEANVAIEDAVMTGGDLVTAMQLLSSSEDALTSARATLGTVAALWSSVRTPEVDFGEQQKLISDARSTRLRWRAWSSRRSLSAARCSSRCGRIRL